jgi:hypothetical protein
MAKCKSCGSPTCSGCSPNKHTSQKYGKDNEGHYHYKDKDGKPISRFSTTPVKQIVDPLAQQQQMIQPMTNVPPAGSSLVNPFSPKTQATAQSIFGTQPMMQNAVGAPTMFKDQTGDGKITQADVIKARVEGYKK